MPRVRRATWPGVPHHVTQRGNRRTRVFFSDADRLEYLRLLREYSNSHSVEVRAYCLMGNHVHAVMVPSTVGGLEKVLRPLHMRFAQRVNRARGWKGHLWQGRYFSSMLDERYLWAAIRYVELNPVRAGLVTRAQDYRWSSAAAHCREASDPVLTRDRLWNERLGMIANWSDWLAAGDTPECLETLRRHADRGLPCGSAEFVARMEQATARVLRARPRGRPSKQGKGDATLF